MSPIQRRDARYITIASGSVKYGGDGYNRGVRTMTAEKHQREPILIATALLFGWLNAASLWLQSHSLEPVLVVLLLTVLAGGAHLWLNRVAPHRDALLLPVAIFLTVWGLQIIARVAPNFLMRQMVWITAGVTALCAVASSRDRLRWLRRYKYTWLLASLLLLCATLLLGVNPTGIGARRWLSVAGVFLQPSEVLRLLMIAFLAAFYSERLGLSRLRQNLGLNLDITQWQHRGQAIVAGLRSLAPLAPSFLMWIIAVALQATQQDIGASALLLVTYAFMLYLATGKPMLPAFGLLLLLLAIGVGYFFSSLIALRINIWLNPWLDPQGTAFQIVQSLISVASGGLFGQGPGQGRPIYVPAVHTDFPFAAIGEEYGFIGALGLILLFGLLILRAWRIARHTHSAYSLLLSGGLAVLFTTQLFVIIGGNLALIPLTGVTVPFVSYGGSSLLVSYISVGLLIRLSCDFLADNRFPPTSAGNKSLNASSDIVLRVTPRQQSAARYGLLICMTLLAVISAAAGYWGIVRGPALVDRPDNPRKVDIERAIDRGSILARDGTELAYSKLADQPSLYLPPQYNRIYPIPAAAPIVGYYSLWHGVGGIEAHADPQLRGQSSYIDDLLHRTQIGKPYTTTIDIQLQEKVAYVLSDTTGAGIIMNWRTGQVLALVSTPIYDPSTLDATWEQLRARADAPLLNRATQGLYQPGELLQWIYRGGNDAEKAANQRNNVWDSSDRFDLGKVVPFELSNSSVPYPASSTYSETIGQGNLRVTPLRMAVTVAHLAAGHPVTPTVHSNGQHTAGAPLQIPSQPQLEYVTYTESGAGRYVSWYVAADNDYVTVLALESLNAGTDNVKSAVRQLRSREISSAR